MLGSPEAVETVLDPRHSVSWAAKTDRSGRATGIQND